MKKHSIKVPRLYKVSAQVAKEVSEGIGSIKNLVYEKQKKHPNIKAIYALVTTLFQKSEEIETLLKRSQLLVKEIRFDPWLAKVLIVELLWGKKSLPGQSKPENTIRAYEQIFKAHLSDSSTEENCYKEKNKPRYVRVNTLKCSLDEAIEGFRDEGWILSQFLDKTNYDGYLEKINSLKNDEFVVDIHVSNLLVFPPGTEFYRHPAYKNGSIILQDKASCLPVQILGAPPGSTVLDMCAAPGMKTTHLAAALNDKGVVYATERNPKRFETLNKIIASSGATCIKTLNVDILTCTKDNFNGVEYILVDPSCSGTGMTDRSEENEVTVSRLESLSGFQIKILRHALTRFPDAKRVVYSTCSLLPEENEDVVRQVLETNYNFKLIPARNIIDTWKNFGSPYYGDVGKFCMYSKPGEDYTNGFFVAVFERLAEGEENQFFNTRIFNFKKHVQANEKWKHKKQQKYDQTENEEFEDAKQNKNKICVEKLEDNEKYKEGNECFDFSEEQTSKKKNKKKRIAIVDEIEKKRLEENEKYKEGNECFDFSEEQTSKKKNKKKRIAIVDEIEKKRLEESDVDSGTSEGKKSKKQKSAPTSEEINHVDLNAKEKKKKRKQKMDL